MHNPVIAGYVFLLCCTPFMTADDSESDESGSNEFSDDIKTDVSQPLYLSPYIKQGRISLARNLAKNDPSLFSNLESFSGFLTVNETAGANAFFWFFSAETKKPDAPLILWVQGEPGLSSIFGVFFQIGPFELMEDLTLRRREHYWSKTFNVLFVDTGASGFGHTSTNGEASKFTDVGSFLFRALLQFFKIFRDLRRNPFYIIGDHYAGKIAPALAFLIDTHNEKGRGQIEFKGVAIGNGLIDPVNMMGHGVHLHHLGLLDDEQLFEFGEYGRRIVQLARAKKWNKASKGYYNLFLNGTDNQPNFLFSKTGFSNQFNILNSQNDGCLESLVKFVNQPQIKAALHVGNTPFQDGKPIQTQVWGDLMKSALPLFVEVVEKHSVLLYSGQLDARVPYSTTIDFLKKMKWSGEEQYKNATRKVWRDQDSGVIAGYTKSVYHGTDGERHFTEVLIRNAGHYASKDQPKWVLDLITKFITLKNPF